MTRKEAQMIAPIRQLLYQKMFIDITELEFSVGYGIADVVGAKLCSKNCAQRENLGLAVAFDHVHVAEVLIALYANKWTSFKDLTRKISFSESTLRKKVLPKLVKLQIIERINDSFRLGIHLPKPTQNLIAVEAKQIKWKEAILQARRYSFFADETYIAVWSETVKRVDRALLYRHRLGLISVESNFAEVIVEAPKRKPREPKFNLYSAEFFYGKHLNCSFLKSSFGKELLKSAPGFPPYR